MFFEVRKFKKIGLNKRVFNEDYTLRLCEETGLNVQEADLEQEAFYIKFQGKATLYIDRRLRGLRRLHVLLHELAHHLLHVRNQQNAAYFFLDGQNSKEHHEAEAFALIAMLPESFLRRLLAGDMYDELGDYPKELVERRLRLLGLYGV